MTKTKLLGGILFFVAVTAVVLFGSTIGATQLEADSGPKTATIAGLRYTYWIVPEKDGSYTILSDYALATSAEIQAAINAMDRIGETFASGDSPFEAEIVFAHPLSVVEFRAFAQSAKIAPINNVLRGIDSSGQVAEMHAPPVWAKDANGRLLVGKPVVGGDPLDASALDRFATGHHQIRTVGVVTTDVMLDAQTYAQVRKDPRVYVVDVMRQVLINAVHSAYPGAPNAKIDVVNPALYAALEKARNVLR
jgi:hypothetical protein